MKKIEMFLPVKTAAFLRPSCRILTKRYFASAPVPPSFGDSPFETAKRVVGCPSAPMRVMPNPYGPYAAVSPTTPLIDIHSTTVHVSPCTRRNRAAMLFLCLRQEICDFAVYESLVYCPNNILICLFTSRCSTPSEILKPHFSKFAADYLGKSMASSSEGDTGSSIPHVFLTVDVDACPRAAYHADIDVRSIVYLAVAP